MPETPDSRPPEIGREIGGYRITHELAEGGMGLVFRGVHLKDDTPVAIKTLRKEFVHRREDVGRFIREAGIYKRLIHPNLMRFYAFGFDPLLGFYLVTELLVGRDLEEALDALGDEAMPLEKALDIALQICAGLAAAHDEGIIHRDLKPGNVFLVEEGDREIAKVFDFGIAKLLEPTHDIKLTMDGATLGTPLYMAPEQIRGEQQLGPPADIYALGVIIYQMVTGTPPFTGRNPMTILTAHLRTPPPLLRKHNRALAGTELESLLQDMLAKDPFERPRDLEKVKLRLWHTRQHLSPDLSQGTLMEVPNFDALQAMFGDERAAASPSKEREKPAAVLLQKSGEQEREVGWLLPGDSLSVGSSPDADIRLKHPSLSPTHAELFCAAEGWITIRSLKGSPLRVNGAAVTSMVLRSGDWITLGQVELRLHCF